MDRIDRFSVERHARELRRQELRRLEVIAAERMRLYARLLGASAMHGLHWVSELLRPLFSWTPQRHVHH